ncbi:rsbT co-antagonist protein RsbR [Gammaproteobacteria bacterium]
MPDSEVFNLAQLITVHREGILQLWVKAVLAAWGRRYTDINELDLRTQTGRLLEALRTVFAEGVSAVWEPSPTHAVVILLHHLSAERAKVGYTPTDTALYVMTLKGILRELLEQQSNLSLSAFSHSLGQIDRVMDRLALLTFNAYTETRERVITQQSLSLLELSTPVVRLWDRLLLLPLIGVIDTQRARQITERMLEAIAHYEATVAILDVTGVPVLDTSVAGHLMKTVAAARMLGAQVVMTGISPDGAQTLIKLGIAFQDVITRASLRAGVAEGLRMIGKRVVAA